MKALQFWDQVPGLPDSKVWHFHPMAFIEFFKRCHWMSLEELKAIYPDSAQTTLNANRIHLNRVIWKYGITSPTRMAYLLGQVQQESGGFTKFFEGISDEKADAQYGGRQDLGNTEPGDGHRFKGHGMKQLTGRYNHMKYWVYRGWLPPSWLGKRWFFKKEELKMSEAEKATIRKTFSSPAPIDDADKAAKGFNAVDTGGYYWLNGASHQEGRPIAKRLKEGVIDRNTANAVSKDVNPYEKGEPTINREFNSYRIWDVVGDETTPRYDVNAYNKAVAPYREARKKKKK